MGNKVNMKEKKKRGDKLLDALLEIVMEVVLTLVCFGIGALVMGLFGKGVDFADGDFIIFIGIIVLVAVTAVACSIIKLVKTRFFHKED